MATRLTSKGQVTIPKQIRDTLDLTPGCAINFDVSQNGEVILYKVGARMSQEPDRFEKVRGKADIKWRTDDLMALLRGEA
jgi:AbrB family looped-hinge helix DNA binding protein